MPSRATSNLIYLLCFGDSEYRRMTELCIESLRGPGRFSGDIMVFTDGCYITSRPDVIVYDASHIIERYVETIQDTVESTAVSQGAVDNSVAWHEHQMDAAAAIRKAAIKALKPELAFVIDHTRYARIAVMDTDMLAIDDVNPFFDVVADGVVGILEGQLGNTMLSESCGGALVRPDELAEAGARTGICVGFLCATPKVFQYSMTQWSQAIRTDAQRLNFWADQPYFNVLVLRNQIPFQPLPDMWIDNPPQYVLHGVGHFALHDETKLFHFWWFEKEIAIAQMESLLAAIRDGASRHDLDVILRDQLTSLRAAVAAGTSLAECRDLVTRSATRQN